MDRVIVVAVALCLSIGVVVHGHGSGASITWNREIARIVYDKCASCHRRDGVSFSLMTYAEVQPRANAIKEAVLTRRMPPWGAVKGFGQFRNDGSLSQEQIELITKWVDGGIRRGNNPGMLPESPTFPPPASDEATVAVRIHGPYVVERPFTLDGVRPERLAARGDVRIVAILPNGKVEPLVWLRGYDAREPHAFLLRRPLALPTGTQVQGVPADASVALLTR